jgi:hypothetical protein
MASTSPSMKQHQAPALNLFQIEASLSAGRADAKLHDQQIIAELQHVWPSRPSRNVHGPHTSAPQSPVVGEEAFLHLGPEQSLDYLCKVLRKHV